MKKAMIPFLFLFMAWSYFACKKDSSGTPASASTALDAAKTSSIKKGEPVLFSMNSTGSTVTWSVSPSANVRINNSGNKAAILFGKAGTYVVNAMSGNTKDSVNVHVNDSTYGGGGATDSVASLTGDQIQLTVSQFGQRDSSGLLISAVTTNSYNCLNHSLLVNLGIISGTDYTINFSGVEIPTGSNCTSGSTTAAAFIYPFPIVDGSHVFKVVVSGTIYTGSFVKSGSTYTFTWPYSSGVTLSPLVVN